MRRSMQIILTVFLTASLLGLAWYVGSRGQKPPLAEVLVVLEPVQAGEIILKENLGLLELPASLVQAGWLQDPADAAGQTCLVDLVEGEILQSSRLGQIQPGVHYATSPGRRLMTIQPEAAAANGYWLADGSIIDVFLVPRQGQDSEIQVLREVKVLRVLDAAADGKMAAGTPMLCLDLAEEQALLLACADNWYTLKIAAVSQ